MHVLTTLHVGMVIKDILLLNSFCCVFYVSILAEKTFCKLLCMNINSEMHFLVIKSMLTC